SIGIMASIASLRTLFAKSAFGLAPRRGCSTAAAAVSEAANTSSKTDAATVELRGTVERLLTAGPKHCLFIMRTRVTKPDFNTPISFQHNVKSFGPQADKANSLAKIGARLQVQGILTYERRFRNKPAGEDNPYRCVIEAVNIKSDD
ncbi:hypothetical protein BOX15_Mlig002424g4, partial [Macrostomum lignano]